MWFRVHAVLLIDAPDNATASEAWEQATSRLEDENMLFASSTLTEANDGDVPSEAHPTS